MVAVRVVLPLNSYDDMGDSVKQQNDLEKWQKSKVMIIDFTIKDNKQKSQSRHLSCSYWFISQLIRGVDRCVRCERVM